MPHNFFRKRACIEARDHGEPSRAVKSAERRNGINGGDPASEASTGEEAVYAGFALLLSERRAVVSSPRGERPALRRVDTPRQDRKALRKPGFPFQEGRLRRFGLSRGNPVPALRDGVSYWALFPGLDGISDHIKQIIKRDLE
jgi:hypothetical protein